MKLPAAAWKSVGLWLLRGLAAMLAAGTLLSATDFNEWWIRIWDFPRLQILIALVATGAALWVIDRRSRPWLPVVLAALSIWQAYRIFPYTALADPEVKQIASAEAKMPGCFTVLSFNVLQTNRAYDRTAKLIRDVDPDILLLMETDRAWVDAMAPMLKRYPGQLHRPLSNTYGMIFATRMPMRDGSVQDIAEPDTPSMFATLRAGKQVFRMIALHPRPPTVGQDSEERDAEIVLAANYARSLAMPAITIGDFNDVAWSDTTRLFQELGGFLDPRIGRGTYATFPADMTWLGWPLDYLFVTKEFVVADMQVGPAIGSDHRPVIARLCLNPAAGQAGNATPRTAGSDEKQDAAEVLEEFRDDSAEDRNEQAD